MPYFWLKALKALDTAVQAIYRRDEPALASLADVRVVESPALTGASEGPTFTGKPPAQRAANSTCWLHVLA